MKFFQSKVHSPNIKSAFALVEVVIVTSIITASLLVLVAVAQKAIVLSYQSLERIQASFILEEGAEVTKAIRDANWTNISGLTVGSNYYLSWNGTSWSFSSTPSTIGEFTRTIVIANVLRDPSTDDISSSGNSDAGTKKDTVTVSWPAGNGTTLSKSLSFYITNIWN